MGIKKDDNSIDQANAIFGELVGTGVALNNLENKSKAKKLTITVPDNILSEAKIVFKELGFVSVSAGISFALASFLKQRNTK